jgi:hypothetical protein
MRRYEKCCTLVQWECSKVEVRLRMERSVDNGEGRRIDGQGVKVVVDGAEEKR